MFVKKYIEKLTGRFSDDMKIQFRTKKRRCIHAAVHISE